MSPKHLLEQKRLELGRDLTLEEHIEVIEERLWAMRVRFYVIIAMLVLSIVGGVTATLYVYQSALDKTQLANCQRANERWTRLRNNLAATAGHQQPSETRMEYLDRYKRTLSLLDGIFDVDCATGDRVPPKPPPTAIVSEKQ